MEATAYIYTNSEQMQQQQQQTNQQIKNDYFTPDQIISYNIMKKNSENNWGACYVLLNK